MFKQPKCISYANGSIIELLSDNLLLFKSATANFYLADDNKPIIHSNTGEKIIESYLSTDDTVPSFSFAKISFKPGGFSALHHHVELTEEYYILQGKAQVIVDEVVHVLDPGGHIKILPGQKHQVINQSIGSMLELLVYCTPAWQQKDHILEPNNDVFSHNKI